METQSAYQIQLPVFEGPFDLLLFFIRRDELDIYDIPISKVTKDFLAYIHQLEQLNLEVASEFILMVGTLMSIKAKMLLPRPELDEDGEEIDPRADLVKHLLEYKQYKATLGQFAEWEEEMLGKHTRGAAGIEQEQIAKNHSVDMEMQDLSLYSLLKVYKQVLERMENRPVTTNHRITPYPYTVEDQKAYILARLETKQRLSFDEIIQLDYNKVALVFNLLAILDLLQNFKVRLFQGQGFNSFYILPR